MNAKGISRNWKFVGEVFFADRSPAGHIYRTSESTWEIARVCYGRRIPCALDGRVFSREEIKAEFEYLGVRDFGASGLVKQWKQRASERVA